MTNLGFAVAVCGVYANAPAIVLAPASANVDPAACLCATGVIKRRAGKRFVLGALGLNIDKAAKAAAARRRAVQESAGALEYLHPFDHLGRQNLARQYAVQPVKGQ